MQIGVLLQNLLCYGPNKVKGKGIATLEDEDYCPGIKISAVIGGLVAGVMVLVVIFFCSLGYYRKVESSSHCQTKVNYH